MSQSTRDEGVAVPEADGRSAAGGGDEAGAAGAAAGGDARAGGDELVVEAPTAGKALEAVTSQLGPDATIVSASKVTRGGIGGFFSRELVQLRARPRATGDGEAAAGGPPRASEGTPAVARILQQLATDVEQQETTFADALRRQLSPDPTATGGTPAGTVRPPAAAPPPRRDWPTPRWSDRNLRLVGMPSLVTDACADLHPADDLAWVRAIAGAVSTLCRPLPEGPAAFAGPRAERLAGDLALPVSKPPASAPATGSFAAGLGDTDRHRDWLDANRRERWLHLVVGGDDWRGFVLDEPLAASWVGDRAVGDALRLCAELGLVLGHGVGEAGDPVRRANPVDVALAIRSLVPRE